ncbi:MAG: S1 RNA-binding domain-containing protein [Hydrogenothermaceae bacterium]
MNEFEKAVSEELTTFYEKNQLVKGKIIKITDKEAFIDIGQKVEAVLNVQEVEGHKEGDEIEAYFTGKRTKDGYFILSRRSLVIKDKINRLKEAFEKGLPVKATVVSSSDKGYTVNIEGITAFMPKSQSASSEELPIGYTFDGKITKFEERKNGVNIVVSRKAILEEEKKKEKEKILSLLKEGQVVKAKVIKILEKGLVLSIDNKLSGFLPQSELSWDKSIKPQDFQVGQELEVMIIEIRERQPIFSLKRLQENPWDRFDKNIGDVVEGKIKEIEKNGIVVDIEGVEGFIPNSHIAHYNYLSAKKNYKVGQTVKAKIIELDKDKRRLRLSIKDITPNPVEKFLENNPVGSIVEAKVKDVKQKIAFIDLGDIEGILKLENATDNKNVKSISSVVKEGHTYKFKVLGKDKDKIVLGLKQIAEDSFNNFISKHKVGDVVEFEVKKLIEKGAIVDIGDSIEGFIPVSEISKDRINIPSDVLSLHQKGQAKITKVDKENKRVILSIKQLILDQEKAKAEEERKKQEEEKKKQLLEKLSKKEAKTSEENKEGLGTLGEILKNKLKERG